MPNRSMPPKQCEEITPDDDTVFQKSRGYTVGVAGNLNVLFAGDTSPVILPARQAGVDYGGFIVKILSTSTTATGIFIYR